MLLEIVFPPLLQYVLDDVDDAHLLFSLFHYPPALAIFVSALVLLNREIQNLSSLSYFRLQKQRFSDICRYFFSFFLALSLSLVVMVQKLVVRIFCSLLLLCTPD